MARMRTEFFSPNHIDETLTKIHREITGIGALNFGLQASDEMTAFRKNGHAVGQCVDSNTNECRSSTLDVYVNGKCDANSNSTRTQEHPISTQFLQIRNELRKSCAALGCFQMLDIELTGYYTRPANVRHNSKRGAYHG